MELAQFQPHSQQVSLFPASPPFFPSQLIWDLLAELVGGLFSNAISAIFKRLWTITSTPKTGIALPMLFFHVAGFWCRVLIALVVPSDRRAPIDEI